MGLKWHEGGQTISLIGWTKNYSWYKKIKSLFKDSASIWIGPLSIQVFIDTFVCFEPISPRGDGCQLAHVTRHWPAVICTRLILTAIDLCSVHANIDNSPINLGNGFSLNRMLFCLCFDIWIFWRAIIVLILVWKRAQCMNSMCIRVSQHM